MNLQIAAALLLFAKQGSTFSPTTSFQKSRSFLNSNNQDDLNADARRAARLVGYIPESERQLFTDALFNAGFQVMVGDNANAVDYSFSRATGMLKRERNSGNDDELAPQWVPLVKNMENVLVANGWSFLDPDENEPLSAFDVDAANIEGQYKPKWGGHFDKKIVLSQLGFSLQKLPTEEIQEEATALKSDLSRSVLLEGATDPPGVKETHNGVNFSGSMQHIPEGVFFCALGGMPLFSSFDLSPSTATSGWLSFSRPLSPDHVVLVEPKAGSLDQRVEVLCAKTGCHLGHYFGSDGYCINASALNFISSLEKSAGVPLQRPFSWKPLVNNHDRSSCLLSGVFRNLIQTETIILGAGCFWHVEFSLGRLPGVTSTEVGYAGGSVAKPTYEQVCHSNTGHAEVVRVEFDPTVLPPKQLLDCFLAMHDPTKVRAMGKHAQGTGQYRSCIFVESPEAKQIASDSLLECRSQLGKELSTEIRMVEHYWTAEDRHQYHDEKRNPEKHCTTFPSVVEWLSEYGKRAKSIMGSATTLDSQISTW